MTAAAAALALAVAAEATRCHAARWTRHQTRCGLCPACAVQAPPPAADTAQVSTEPAPRPQLPLVSPAGIAAAVAVLRRHDVAPLADHLAALPPAEVRRALLGLAAAAEPGSRTETALQAAVVEFFLVQERQP